MRKLATSKLMIDNALEAIMNDGGEGVILRKQKSLYESGRSASLIKLKVLVIFCNIKYLIVFQASREDTEALVAQVNDDSYVLKLYNSRLNSFS